MMSAEARAGMRVEDVPADDARTAPAEWMSLRTLLGYVELSERTIRELMRRAQDPLPFTRVGRKPLFSRAAVDAWLQRQGSCDAQRGKERERGRQTALPECSTENNAVNAPRVAGVARNADIRPGPQPLSAAPGGIGRQPGRFGFGPRLGRLNR